MAHFSASLFQTFIKPYDRVQQEEARARIQLLLGSPKEVLDQVVSMVRVITGASISSINIVNPESVKVLCQTGQLDDAYSHEQSFCGFAVLDPDVVTVVEDASKDMRFAKHAIVTGNEHIRFYAGAHVLAPGGMPVATLCAYDTVPRTLSNEQVAALGFLARSISQRLELRTYNQKLEAEKRKFEAFMDSGPTIAFIKDHEGRYTYANRMLLDTFHLEADEILGKRDIDLWPEVGDQLAAHDRWIMSQSDPVEVTEEGPLDDQGKTTWWQSYKFPIPGVPAQLGGVALNVTALHANRENSFQPSAADLLTGLPNKQTLLRELPGIFERKQQAGERFALVHLDIDRFRPFTEKYGEAAGDAMKCRFADSIRRAVSEADRPYHLRCDEFILIMEAPGSEDELRQRCEQFLFEARKTLLLPSESSDVTISIGVVISDGRDDSPEALMARADQARKNAKRQGSGCFLEI